MNLEHLEKRTNAIIDDYIRDLDNYTLEQLLMKPSEESWSLGQVYLHLWMAAKGFFFKNAEKCLSGEGTSAGSKNITGYLVFLFGKMPTVKVKMPGKVAVQPFQPESKEQLVAKLNEIKTLTSQYIQKIPSADPSKKTKHPFLGYLNTADWIRLCEMHFKHHLAQKKRIETHFGWNSSRI